MSWTDDRVEKLKTMWAEGQSASQIAKELGGVTRNAVIGKVHRLGLSNRAAAKTAAPAADAKPAKPAAQPAAEGGCALSAPFFEPGTVHSLTRGAGTLHPSASRSDVRSAPPRRLEGP